MYINDDYWEAIEDLSKASQDRILGAIVRLFYLDEREPSLKPVEKAVFVALRDRVILSRKRTTAVNSKKGKAKPKAQTGVQTKVQTGVQNAVQTDIQNGVQTGVQTGSNGGRDLLKREIEREIESTTATAVVQESGGGEMEIVYEDDGLAAFIAQALDGWNRISGKHYPALPGDCIRGLTEAYRNGVTPEQLDIALARVGSWQEKYRRTPRAAFADGNLYKWITEEEVESYADLDEIFG